MPIRDRIELLKSNIIHFTKDLLHFEVARDPPARSQDEPPGASAG